MSLVGDRRGVSPPIERTLYQQAEAAPLAWIVA
jgi:hypothetical protein